MKKKKSRNIDSEPKVMTIDDVEQSIKAKITTIKKILPNFGAGGSFSHNKDEERFVAPELANTVVVDSS